MWAYLRRFGAFPPAARAFLGGALLIELGHAFLWTLQNLYVRSVGHGEAEAGMVLSAGTIGIVLATYPSASMYDRLGPRRSLTLSCVGAAVGIAGLACSESLWALMAFATLNGAAFSLHWVVTAPFVMSISTPESRSHLFGAEFATHSVAQTIGPLAAGYLAAFLAPDWAEAGSLRITLIIGALASLCGVLCYRRLMDRAGDPPAAKRSFFAILRRDHWHLWVRLAIPNVIIGTGAGLTIPFINLYLTDRFGMDKDGLGLVMAAAAATMTVAVLAVPYVAARFGFVRATLLSELLSIPFFVSLAFTMNVTVAVTAVILRQALMNVCHPLWRNFMMEITPDEWRASVNSLAMLAWNLGWGLSVVFGGSLIEASAGLLGADLDGYTLPILITVVIYLAAIFSEYIFFWDRRDLGKPRPPEVLSSPHEGQEN